MSHHTHSRFTNGILFTLLLSLLLTCPMKREIKQALAIPVQMVGHRDINNNSFCIKFVPETTFTAKQTKEDIQRSLFVPASSLSISSFINTDAPQQAVYSNNPVRCSSGLFILYLKLLI